MPYNPCSSATGIWPFLSLFITCSGHKEADYFLLVRCSSCSSCKNTEVRNPVNVDFSAVISILCSQPICVCPQVFPVSGKGCVVNCCGDFTESRIRALWSLPQALKACYRAENGRQVYAKNQPAQDNLSSASLHSLSGIFSHAESPREVT
jgi:hypothetical protein